MAKNVEKDTALEQVLADIEKQFGKGAIMKLGEQEHKEIEVSARIPAFYQAALYMQFPDRRSLRSVLHADMLQPDLPAFCLGFVQGSVHDCMGNYVMMSCCVPLKSISNISYRKSYKNIIAY